ncbi:MAG: hypothetical protein Q9163_002829 [Psora crenata]
MDRLNWRGSTSQFERTAPGVILKAPMKFWMEHAEPETRKEVEKAFFIEKQILERLGGHPRIVPFVHPYFVAVQAESLLLAEASHGNLQEYIDGNNASMDDRLRWKWCLQATEGVVYAHQKGIIHSDLRPENYLVHDTRPANLETSLDLWLCDFGGSMCTELGLDGGHLPDDPFFDPRAPWVSTPATDIFSLGSIFYTILTGFWPYRSTPPPITEEKLTYMEEVNKLFAESKFPNVSKLAGGNVIMGCWENQYETAEDVLRAIQAEMTVLGM